MKGSFDGKSSKGKKAGAQGGGKPFQKGGAKPFQKGGKKGGKKGPLDAKTLGSMADSFKSR